MIPVCKVTDVPAGEGRAVTVLDRRIAIFHAESGWYALDDRCPHRGGPLSDGVLAERSVICPLHERRFDLVEGRALGPGCGVTAHRVIVAAEDVFVELADASADEEPGSSSAADAAELAAAAR